MIKVTKDNFVWKIVNEKAKEVYNSGLFDLYVLYDDDSESLILNDIELNKYLEQGLDIGIEVGFLKLEENENI